MDNKKEYAVAPEKSITGFGAFVPDLSGCIAAGKTEKETLELIKKAITFHIEGLREQGKRSRAMQVEVHA